MRTSTVLFAIAAAMPVVANAATVTVNAITDDGPGDCSTTCTLRDAILSASPLDTIVFSPLLPYPATIVLNGTELYVFRNVTIAGPGADALSVSGNNKSRIMEVDFNATVTISGLTVRDGFAPYGGAFVVRSGSKLELSRVLVTANQAAGLDNTSAVDASGGAIYAEGAVTISDSFLTANQVRGGHGADLPSCPSLAPVSAQSGGDARGGAGTVSNAATLVLSNVVFAGNSAVGGAGGNAPSGSACGAGAGGQALGGAIENVGAGYFGFVTATNNSLTAGTSGSSGIAALPGPTRGTDLVVAGGARTHVFAHNTVFVDGTAQAKACEDETGTYNELSLFIYAWGSNFDNDSSCTGFDLHGDAQLQPVLVGGQLLNIFPQSGSPLIDTATDCLDAEGYLIDHDVLDTPRPIDGNLDNVPRCDVGAVEYKDSIFANGFE